MTPRPPFTTPSIPSTEPEFTKILREANIDINDAHKFLFVREWVKRNKSRVFIPPEVLKAMGMDTSRWD